MRTRLGSKGMRNGRRLLPLLAILILAIRLFPPAASGFEHHPPFNPAGAALGHVIADEDGTDDHPLPEGHGGSCHFCRLDDLALPLPSLRFTVPDQPVAAGSAIREDNDRPAIAYRTPTQPRAPPRPE